MVKRCFFSAILLFSLFLSSCTEGSFLFPALDEQQEVRALTLESGTVLETGSDIPIELEYLVDPVRRSVVIDRAEIEVVDSLGTNIGTAEFSGEDVLEGVQNFIALPEMDDGLYTLRYRLYEADSLVVEQERSFFYVNDYYQIPEITAYPATLIPGTGALLTADLDIPEGADPYLRWTLNDELQAEGLLSEGLDQLRTTSPSEIGVYRVRVDLYPVAPSGQPYEFESSIQQQLDLFVSRSRELSPHDLQPEASYFSLLHFTGDFFDRGYRTLDASEAIMFEPIGDVALDVYSDLFGYHLDAGDGFRADDFLLPLEPEADGAGTLQPFTITIRYVAFGTDAAESRVFQTASADEALSAELLFGSDSGASLQMRYNGTDYASSTPADVLSVDSPTELSVSVLPRPDSGRTLVMWFVDGVFVAAEEIATVFSGIPVSGGTSVIAGETGPELIVDEFGVYARNEQQEASVDPSVFFRSMHWAFESDLAYAEGFDAEYLPSDVIPEGIVSVQRGRLILEQGARARFPLLYFRDGSLNVEVPLSGDPEARVLEFSAIDGEVLAWVDGQGRVYVSESSWIDAAIQEADQGVDQNDEDTVSFTFEHQDPELVITAGDQSIQVSEIGSDFEGLQMEALHQAPVSVPVEIQSVLAYREASLPNN